ncbi:MAG: FliG C-terminal domain-containing protein [Candidatus Margulisiibacteriota bacterium]
MNYVKKVLAVVLIFLMVMTICVAVERLSDNTKLEYEKKIETNLQRMLDKMVGDNKAVIAIDVVINPGGEQVNYTEQANVALKPAGEQAKKYLMPGVPALKDISEAAGPGLPFDFKRTEVFPEVSIINVTLLIDSTLQANEVTRITNFVRTYLGLNTQKDKIIVLRQRFAPEKESLGDKALKALLASTQTPYGPGAMGASMSQYGAGHEGAAGAAAEAEKEKKSAAEEKAEGGMLGGVLGGSNASMVMLFAGLGLLVVIFIIVLMVKAFKSGEEKPAAGMGAGMGAQGMGMPGYAAAGNGAGAAIAERVHAEDSDYEESTVKERKYFQFINAKNIFKLKYILQIKIAMNEASPRTIAMILSCLRPQLAAAALIEYPSNIQAEIISYLVNPEDYDAEQLSKLETEIVEKMSTLLGGHHITREIIDNMSTAHKKLISQTIAEQHPAVLDTIRNFIILFDDILALDKNTVRTIFSELDPNVIAPAISKLHVEKQKLVLDQMPEGMKAMLNQWIDLKGASVTEMESEEAQMHIIEFAKMLEEQGRIEIKKIDFLKFNEVHVEDLSQKKAKK